MAFNIAQADVMDWCGTYDGPKFHSLLCDPPYSLGFMNKAWDGDIAFQPETWAALAEHLHPGAFGMAFASSRGWHRLAVAIEDAGLRIHPSIFGWVFGSGFPKATRVKDAPEFEGHRYGLQAMKPALEPIIVWQKPYSGKPVESIVETGAGAINIDGGRIEGQPHCGGKHGVELYGSDGKYTPGPNAPGNPSGRWPANFYLGDEEAARRLGEQSGELKSGSGIKKKASRSAPSIFDINKVDGSYCLGDTGTAARFFFNVNRQIDESDPVLYCAKASRKERDAGLDGFDEVIAKRTQDGGDDTRGRPTPRNRNAHPTVKPIDLTRWLATLLLPPAEYAPRRILIPFAGSGSECIGAHLAGWEAIAGIEMEEEYVDIAEARLAYWTKLPEYTTPIRGNSTPSLTKQPAQLRLDLGE